MKKFLRETKYLLIFFMLLTIATALSFVDVNTEKVSTRSPTEIMHSDIVLRSTQNEDLNEVPRRPAAAIEKQSLQVSIFCELGKEKKNHLNVDQQLIMLSLSSCVDVKSVRHLWIKNETNGFKAQVFKIKNNNYRTDFIQLNKGENKIRIETIPKDGQKRVQSLEIMSGS